MADNDIGFGIRTTVTSASDAFLIKCIYLFGICYSFAASRCEAAIAQQGQSLDKRLGQVTVPLWLYAPPPGERAFLSLAVCGLDLEAVMDLSAVRLR